MSLLSTGTYGCSCIGGDPAAAFNRAKAVFIGQMISGSEKVSQDAIKEIKRRTHILDPQFWKTVSEGEAGNVNFAVKKVFKGNIKDEVQVEIHSDTDIGVGCGFYHLLRGEQYLVYAYGEDGDSLSSGSCTRTSSINNPATKNEDLKFLEHLPLKGSGGNIRGSIKKESAINEQLIPFTQRITVNVISADNRVIKVKSDKNGQFKAEKIKPGTYTVFHNCLKTTHWKSVIPNLFKKLRLTIWELLMPILRLILMAVYQDALSATYFLNFSAFSSLQ